MQIKNILFKLRYFLTKKNNKAIDDIISFDNKPVMIIYKNLNFHNNSKLFFKYKFQLDYLLYHGIQARSNKRNDIFFVQKTVQSSPSLFKSNCNDYSANSDITSAMDCFYNCINRFYREFFG